MASNKAQEQIISSMTRAEQDTQSIRQRDEQIKRLTAEVREYIAAEHVLVAAGLISEDKVKQAHEIVQKFV